jgi:predicted nucleic acid-binding protein
MGMKKLFFDSYALCEISYGNPGYAGYTEAGTIILTQLNLMEFYYHLIQNYGKEEAERMVRRYEEYAVPFSTETIIEAMEFRRQHKAKRLSYTDALGYAVAMKSGALFLTGDKQFEHLPGVLFVK